MRESQLRLAVFNIFKNEQEQQKVAKGLSLRFVLWFVLLLCSLLCAQVAMAQEVTQEDTQEDAQDNDVIRLQVAEPFIELHTGPGRGFPIFHIVERHDWIEILKRRTDWFRIRTREGKEGWAYIDQLEQTFAVPGKKTRFARIQKKDFFERDYEFGVGVGDFEGASLMSLYAGMTLSKNLAAELTVSQATGSFTNTIMMDASIVSSPFPGWSASPFFAIGAGTLQSKAKSTAIVTEEIDETTVNVGLGVKWYLTRRFVLRADVKEYIAFLGEDYNGEFVEWKLGFSFFY